MPKFNCSYAYDVPHYRDFVVEAKTPEDAQRVLNKALEDKKFDGVTGDICWENLCNERVFVSGLTRDQDTETTMEDIIKEAEGAHK